MSAHLASTASIVSILLTGVCACSTLSEADSSAYLENFNRERETSLAVVRQHSRDTGANWCTCEPAEAERTAVITLLSPLGHEIGSWRQPIQRCTPLSRPGGGIFSSGCAHLRDDRGNHGFSQLTLHPLENDPAGMVFDISYFLAVGDTSASTVAIFPVLWTVPSEYITKEKYRIRVTFEDGIDLLQLDK